MTPPKDGWPADMAKFLCPLIRGFHTIFFGVGGGVEIFLHTNLLSENIFPTKGICTQFPRPKEVGGYMKGAVWSRFEKSYSVLQASHDELVHW
jgi:hypothetical protein